MTDLEFHPVCLAFPDYAPEVFRQRLEDYRKNPDRAGDTAVLVAQDEADGQWKIADGRHHFLICRELDLPCDFVRFTGTPEELAELVLSRNAHRRHCDPSQIAAAIVAVQSWAHGGGFRGNQHTSGKTPRGVLPTQEESAKSAGVGKRTVQRAAKVKEKAPELLPSIRDGKLDAKTAEKVADLPKGDREKVASAEDPRKAAKDALKKHAGKNGKATAAEPDELPAAEEADPENPPADPRFMPHAAEAAAFAGQFANWRDRLRSVHSELKKNLPGRDHVLAKRIDAAGFLAALADLVETLDKNLPDCVCPVCVGTGQECGKTCKYCDGYGIVDRHHHAGLKAKWKHTRARLLELRGGL